MGEIFSDVFLSRLAGKLGTGEMHLGILLGISTAEINGMQRDNRGNYHDLVNNILHKWNLAQKERTSSEMEKELCDAFSEMGRNDIVRYIRSADKKFEVVMKPCQEGAPQTTQDTYTEQPSEDLAKLKMSQEVSQEPTDHCDGDGDGDGKHIMLSYNHGSKELVLRIRDRLKKEGHKVWIDEDDMIGSPLDGMSEAVENASVVIIAASSQYRDSLNCETEAKYAHTHRRPIIPLIVEPGFKPDGWLGMLVRTTMYIDFTKHRPFDDKMADLIKEIKGKLECSPRK